MTKILGMRKSFKFLVFILLASATLPILSFNLNCTHAQPEYYGKVMEDNIYLYSQPNDSLENTLFEIPKSYFVILQGNAENDFYKAKYKDVTGYIKKEQVSPMNGKPENPHAVSSFRVFATEGLTLYSRPSSENSKDIILVPYLSENIEYYGLCNGEISIPEKDGTWYFCKYSNGKNSYKGYLYSVFCDKLTKFEENNENFPLITGDLFPIENSSIRGLSPAIQVVIILAISLPCAFILFLLIRPTQEGKKADKSEKSAIKTKFKRKRKCDYFEFDENDL